MDQDSFRKLMQTPRTTAPTILGGGSRPRISLAPLPPKKKTVDASQPAFKPRNVKKQDSKYRDRASERRVGDGNDYTQVEAVLEDFEKKNAGEDKEKVEAQRKYLGGDSEHSILVKGLDFALLEQNRARAAQVTSEDLDALDEAYMESSSTHKLAVPKKRTREDIVKELKEARNSGKSGNGSTTIKTAEKEVLLLEEAKQKGKFKPIGIKPISSVSEGKKKKPKTNSADGTEKKKKKIKVEVGDGSASKKTTVETSMPPPPPVPAKSVEALEIEEPFDDDFDIFDGAGEYEGLDFNDNDNEAQPSHKEEMSSTVPAIPRRWIETDDEPAELHKAPLPSSSLATPIVPRPLPPNELTKNEDEDMQDDQPMRLVPLSSSAIPSIKELLAMDKAAGSQTKNKRRKDKKKADAEHEDGSKKKSTEEKVERDYKRLKTYTDKKAAAESK
ncbi:hypothetical protein BDN70DRAFT_880981 [Pholiota conissans]|uniref:RED-like N-terminal domain-containing protein n=1 Tax=Pholiota conissans TaxID=109636 RepID=A0A9P5YY23_9AGAR|nr:hypothetical protein BDN70DRAFT_880981 [Pholiota conissans]